MTARVAAFPDGRPCWAEAMLPDVEAGKRFYGELFGWTFETVGADPGSGADQPDAGGRNGSYALALIDGEPAAGLAAKRDGRLPTVWNLYFAASDAAAGAARIEAAGGTVLTPPRPASDPGYGAGAGAEAADGMAVRALAVDPAGAVFGLWQAEGLIGFVVRDGPGAYAWSEVHTRGGTGVDAFYAEVFGYGTGERERGGITLWAPKGEPVDPGHATGGRRVLGEELPAELPPHFLTYFWVEDCGAAARTTARLGGRASLGPEEGPYGRYAVLVDNQGARFAVRELRAEQPGAEPEPASGAGPASGGEPEAESEAESEREPGREPGSAGGNPPGTVHLTAPITPGERLEYRDGEDIGDQPGGDRGPRNGGDGGNGADGGDSGGGGGERREE
jgi:predicted enzyme related to lactoylglutathione lyase